MLFLLKNEHKLIKLLLRLALMLWVMRMRTAAMDYATVTAAMDYATVTAATDNAIVTAAMDNGTVTAATDNAAVTDDSRTPKP